MTQEELAEKLSVTRQTVSCWENGKSEPDLEMIFKIAEVYNISVESLITSEKSSAAKKQNNNKSLFVFSVFIIVTLLFIFLLPLVSQSPHDYAATTVKGEYTSTTQNDISGELIIDTYYDFEQISKCAEEFTKLHPNVKITVNGIGTYGSFEGYQKWIETSLKNGKSADIIDLGRLSSHKYAQNGWLCNIYEFMENDPKFNKSDYYTNVFTAKEFCGGLYSLPFYFYYNVIFISKPLFDKSEIEIPESLDYKSILNIYSAVSKSTDKSPEIAPGILKSSFWEEEFPIYYDYETEKSNFASEEFIEYLELTKEIESTYNPVEKNSEWDKTRVVYSDAFMQNEYIFCEEDINASSVLTLITDWNNIYPPVPLVNSRGDFPFGTYQADYAIAKNCENKELAWEFIKFCISEKDVPEECNIETVSEYVLGRFHTRIPINIKNFYNSFRFQIKYDLSENVDLQNEIIKNGGNIDSSAGRISKVIEQIHLWNMSVNANSADLYFAELIGLEMDKYYYSEIPAEDFAKYLQEEIGNYIS